MISGSRVAGIVVCVGTCRLQALVGEISVLHPKSYIFNMLYRSAVPFWVQVTFNTLLHVYVLASQPTQPHFVELISSAFEPDLE
jgi:hypothetical protein